MNKAGVMRIGALLAVLTVLVGGFAAMPYWTARAEDKTIFGLVQQCGANPPEFLDNVAVSLVDAQGILLPVGATTSGGGFYEFTPSSGTYILRFSLGGYYSTEIGPFRFDGSVFLRKDSCLTKMPDRDATLQVLVVDQVTNVHVDEPQDFAKNFVSIEDAGPGFYQTAGGNFTQVAHAPVWWRTPADFIVRRQSGAALTYPTQFSWYNDLNGTLQIFDPTVVGELVANRRFLNVTYWFSANTTRLDFYPVVPGTYVVKKNGVPWGIQDTDWALDVNTGLIRIIQGFGFGRDSLSVTYQSVGSIPGATVNLYDIGQRQVVSTALTNGTGFATFSIWKAVLELQVSKDQYIPYTASVDTNTVNFSRVNMNRGIVIVGHAFRADNGRPIGQGVVGYLYNVNPLVPEFRKVIGANVSGSLYRFYAEPSQTYRMIVDADGFTAATRTFTTPASPPYPGNPVDSNLVVSDKEVSRSTVAYFEADWNNAWGFRNLTLRSDSTLPWLKFPEIRSLNLQIDFNFGLAAGTANGVRDGAENASFLAALAARVPSFVTSDNFLTTNGGIFNWTGSSSYSVNYNAEGGRAIWVNTSALYKLRVTTPLTNVSPRYFVNVTTPNDANQSVYQDQVVVVDFPRGYEMTDKRITGAITTTGWTVVTVDPGLSASVTSSEIEMTVRKSLNGTARAGVVGPIGKFHVLSDTLSNYTAIVAANTNITFSAEQSIDPVGNIRDANFTWHFMNSTAEDPVGWNITSQFNYTTSRLLANPGHEFTVNLTVTEAGGNKTFRDIKVFVDDTPPVAGFRTNRSARDGQPLQVDEDSPIKFFGDLSRDVAWTGAPAWLTNHTASIPIYRWDWDVNHIPDSLLKFPVTSFEKPGWYNSTLQVVDWVGHNSTVNATIYITANDKTKPTANFVILDPSRDWVITTSLVEGKNYSFNASTSFDNYDTNRNLSYAWHFPGPVNCMPVLCDPNGNISPRKGYDAITTTWGWNVTVWWRAFNVSYNVTLNVTDTGFLGHTPNYVNLTSGIAVAVDVAKHPDLKYVAASLKIEPGQPEEGQLINVSFMIANDANRANATKVRVILTAKDANGAVVLQTGDPEWRDEKWNLLSGTQQVVNTGTKVRLIFRISFPAQGNKSIEIKFNDTNEPYTWVDSQNRITGSVFVKLAGWVIPGAIIGFIALVIGVAFAARTYSRYRSGELVFRRKEKKEKKKLQDEDEKAEPEEDTKGKKRL